MAHTIEALTYIAVTANKSVPLSLLRMTTLLYLSDWRSALQYEKQISDIQWMHPFVSKLPEIAQRLSIAHFKLDSQLNVEFVGEPLSHSSLPREEQECIDFVLRTEGHKGWIESFRLAYSTYPMFSQSPQAILDLVGLAKQYSDAQHLATHRVG